MAAAVKSGKFRGRFLNTIKTMIGWNSMQRVLEKKNRVTRERIIAESFHQRELEIGIEMACAVGNLEAVEFLVDECGVVVDNIKNSCVWSAASERHSNIVKYFIEKHSVDVNLETDQGMGIIHYACVAGDDKFAEYLVKKGANLRSTDNKKVNCLMAGAWAGSKKICEMAIEAGVDVNAKNSKGEHVLHGTIRQGYNVNQSRLNVIDYLVKAGADVNSVNGSNIPVVIYAALTLNGCTKTLGYFLKHPKVHMEDKIEAIKFGGAFLFSQGNEKRGFKFWTRAVELKEKMKEDENNNSAPSCYDFSSYEPACVADVQRFQECQVLPIKFMVALLTKLHIKFGYDCLTQLENFTDVILTLGIYDFYLEVFSFIFLHTFQNNENVNAIPEYDAAFRSICAIIAWEAKKGEEVFPCVLKFFAKMASGFEQRLPHCKTIEENKEEIVNKTKLLRDMLFNAFDVVCPSDDEDDNSDCWSECDDYKDGKHKHMYMTLMMKLSAVILQIFSTHKKEFRPYLRKLLTTNFRDEKGATFFQVAIECIDSYGYHGDEEIQVELVKMLIEEGVNVNATDNYNCTAIHGLARVVYSGNKHLIQEILDLMLQHGAHLDIFNKSGWSGLDEMMDSNVTVYPVANQSLQCLAAKVIMEEGLDYHSTTPKALWEFIELHDPQEHIHEDEIPYAYYSEDQHDEHECEVY